MTVRRFSPFLSIFILLSATAISQQCRITGTIRDEASGEPLEFAHIWIKSLNTGTTSGKAGKYILTIPKGTYSLRASYLGYVSRSLTARADDSTLILNIDLKPSTIEFPEIVVVPGENPAIPIIRKAILAKRRIEDRLHNYRVEAHTKLTAHMNSISGEADSARLRQMDSLYFPFESLTEAYWEKPDKSKEIINARRQINFGGRSMNLINSMPARVNFSRDQIMFGKTGVTGPISEDGLGDYWYDLLGTTEYDEQMVYKIRVSPRSSIQPLIEGMLYIADSTFLVVMVDVDFNAAARGPYIDSLNFRQQFSLVGDEFWLPTDVLIRGKVSIRMMIELGISFDVFSVLKKYRVNDPEVSNVFDDFRLVVSEEADDVDSAEWNRRAMIENTPLEQYTYRLTDSMETQRKEEAKKFGYTDLILGKRLEFDESFYAVPGFLSVYRFNRIEGHGFRLPFTATDPFEPVTSFSAYAGYGFSDKQWKWSLGGDVLADKYYTTTVHGRLFNELSFIDAGSLIVRDESSTIFEALFEYDPRHYFYQSGFDAGVSSYSWLFLQLLLDARYRHYTSASVNTNERLFREPFEYPPNPAIDEGYISSLGAGMMLDFRARILDKGSVTRGSDKYLHVPSIGAEINRAEFASDSWTFSIYKAQLKGEFSLGGWGDFSYTCTGLYSDNKLPTQRLLTLPGTEEGLTSPHNFRTLRMREYGGDRTATAFVEYNLGSMPYRILGLPDVPLLAIQDWGYILFANAGWADMRNSTKDMLLFNTQPVRSPFYEVGFGIDRVLAFLRFDFAWRMNHFRDGANFFFGLSLSSSLPFTVSR